MYYSQLEGMLKYASIQPKGYIKHYSRLQVCHKKILAAYFCKMFDDFYVLDWKIAARVGFDS